MSALEKIGLITIVLLGNIGLLGASIIVGLCSSRDDFEQGAFAVVLIYFLALTCLLIVLIFAWKEGLPCPL